MYCDYDKSMSFVDECMENERLYIEQHIIFYDIIKNIFEMDISLSNLARYFYVMGMFFIEKIDETSFMDYSLSSMQFYKVIEIVLKDKIVVPLLKNFDLNLIIEKAKLPLKLNVESMTLGNIRYIFQWIIKNWDLNNITDNREKEYLISAKNIFNNDKRWVEEIIIIISQNNLDKYRNPPAHTKTLEYEYANESNKICVLFLYMISLMTKKNPFISFINLQNTPYLFKNEN
jgi:hypothetical protein